MFAAASTECLPDLSLIDAIEKLADLEFSNIVIDIHENGNHIKPSQVLGEPDKAVSLCRDTHRLNIAAYNLHITGTGEVFYDQFAACCRLAKTTKVACLTIPSAEHGTPFNEEVEHLRRLVKIASLEGTLVSIKSQIGRLSQDPDTVVVLCDNVKGLGLTLDPSHYICGRYAGRNYDQIFKYVHHVQLRDSTKENLQVRVGQGEIEYGRLVTQLQRAKYRRCLEVNIMPDENMDQVGELRKLRLLLESLI